MNKNAFIGYSWFCVSMMGSSSAVYCMIEKTLVNNDNNHMGHTVTLFHMLHLSMSTNIGKRQSYLEKGETTEKAKKLQSGMKHTRSNSQNCL